MPHPAFPSGAVFGFHRGSVSPFAKVVFHLTVTPCDLARKIRPAQRPNRRQCNCRRSRRCRSCRSQSSCCNKPNARATRPPEGRKQRRPCYQRHTQKRGQVFCFCWAVDLAAPFKSSFSRSISSPRLWAILSSFTVASSASTAFPFAVVKHPSGFWFITR